MAKRQKDWPAAVRELLTGLGIETKWVVGFVKEALDDLDEVARSGKIQVVLGALAKLARDPRPKPDGFGHPLGSQQATGDLTGLLSVKLKGRVGLRIVYGLTKDRSGQNEVDVVKVLVVQDREDDKVYREAVKRMEKYRHVFPR